MVEAVSSHWLIPTGCAQLFKIITGNVVAEFSTFKSLRVSVWIREQRKFKRKSKVGMSTIAWWPYTIRHCFSHTKYTLVNNFTLSTANVCFTL